MKAARKTNATVKGVCIFLCAAVFVGCVSGPSVKDNAEGGGAESEQAAESEQDGSPAEPEGDAADLSGGFRIGHAG